MKNLRRRVVISLAAIVILGILFAPALVTAAWHICHRNQIECAGRTFLVPLRWYPAIDNRTATISKLSLIIRPGSPVSALITLSPVAISPKTDSERESAYQSFTSMYWTQMASNVGSTRGPIRAGTGDREARCMETSFNNTEKGMSVACLALGATWIASFDGPPKEVSTFYRVITEAPSTE
jgi:hypothetical protein